MLRNKLIAHSSKLIGLDKKIRIYFLICSFLPVVFCFLSISFAQEQFVYDAKGKRNPFIPLVTADGRLLRLEQDKGATDLLLEGIIYDKDGASYAIVNSEVVRVGDNVGDYQVLKIEEKRLLVIKDGQPQTLELQKEE